MEFIYRIERPFGDHKIEYDASGKVIYEGFNLLRGAGTDVSTWRIFKRTWSAEGWMTQEQYREDIAWDDRATSF